MAVSQPISIKPFTNHIFLQTQASSESHKTTGGPSIAPPPLNIPPSRARRQLAARLAARKEAEDAAENGDDPDAADAAAVEAAELMDASPEEGDIDLRPATERSINEGLSGEEERPEGLNITGLRTVAGLGGAAGRFAGLFTHSDDDSSPGSSDEDGDSGVGDSGNEDDAGRDITANRPEGDYEDVAAESMSPAAASVARRREGKARRQSTTEAKERVALDDGEEDEGLAGDLRERLVIGEDGPDGGEDDRGPFADPVDMRASSSSDEDELVEIRPRRVS